MFKLGISVLLTLGLVLTPLWAAGADLKVGIVDANDILSKSAEGKRAQENFKQKAEQLGKPFVQKRQDLAKQVEEFQKQAGVMKEDSRKRKAEELEKKMAELDRQAQDAQKQLAQLEERELGPILKKLEQAVQAVFQEEKLDLVLDKRVVVANNKSLEITEKVRSKFGH